MLVVAWLTAIACVGMYRLANPPHHDRSLRDCEADWLTYLRTYQGSLGVEAEPSATDAHTWAQSVGCTQWEPFN